MNLLSQYKQTKKSAIKSLGKEKGMTLVRLSLFLFLRAKLALLLGKVNCRKIDDVKNNRKSDTVFVFGSGYSLNDISDEHWLEIQKHDTVGFSGFGVHQDWIDLDYYLIRGWAEHWDGVVNWKSHAQEFQKILEKNARLEQTTFILQHEFSALFCNSLLTLSYLPQKARALLYKTSPKSHKPSSSMDQGLCHNTGTLFDAVHFAFVGGWKKIVLIGVDLYDSRYFWLNEDETEDIVDGKMIRAVRNDRGDRYDETHSTVRNGVVDQLEKWAVHMQTEHVSLECYNEKSLLVPTLPIYKIN